MAYERNRTSLRNTFDPIGSNVIFNGKEYAIKVNLETHKSKTFKVYSLEELEHDISDEE